MVQHSDLCVVPGFKHRPFWGFKLNSSLKYQRKKGGLCYNIRLENIFFSNTQLSDIKQNSFQNAMKMRKKQATVCLF